jgi:hypothetical protein
VTSTLIWAHNALLFCLSLIPFATAYVADTDLAPFPTMVFGALQFACALAFSLLVGIIAARRRGDGEFVAGFRPRRAQDIVSPSASTPRARSSRPSARSQRSRSSSSSRSPIWRPAWSLKRRSAAGHGRADDRMNGRPAEAGRPDCALL